MSVKRLMAAKYLDKIVSFGLLEKTKIGRQNYYINNKLVDLLVSKSWGNWHIKTDMCTKGRFRIHIFRDVYARMGKRIHILMNTNLNPEFGYAIPNRGAYLCFSPMPTWIGKQPIQLVKTT